MRTNNRQSLSAMLTFRPGPPSTTCSGRLARLLFFCGCQRTGVGGRANCLQCQWSSSTAIRNRDPLKMLGWATSTCSLLGLYWTATALSPQDFGIHRAAGHATSLGNGKCEHPMRLVSVFGGSLSAGIPVSAREYPKKWRCRN